MRPLLAWMAAIMVLTLVALGCNRQQASAKTDTATTVATGQPVPTLGPDDAVRDGADVTDSSPAAPATVGQAPQPPLSAARMKQAIHRAGKVALQISFGTDGAILDAGAGPQIEQIAVLLKTEPALRLSIEGHTDASGDDADDRDLSRQRAETVRAALIVQGIDADRLQAQGFGADHPLTGNRSEAGRERNRRIELVRLD